MNTLCLNPGVWFTEQTVKTLCSQHWWLLATPEALTKYLGCGKLLFIAKRQTHIFQAPLCVLERHVRLSLLHIEHYLLHESVKYRQRQTGREMWRKWAKRCKIMIEREKITWSVHRPLSTLSTKWVASCVNCDLCSNHGVHNLFNASNSTGCIIFSWGATVHLFLCCFTLV